MKLKISIVDKGEDCVKAVVYEKSTNGNLGTLYMTTNEFSSFIEMLTYGISDDDTVEVDDSYIQEYKG